MRCSNHFSVSRFFYSRCLNQNRYFPELECPECHDTFNLASEMLQHLSQHAKEITTVQCKQTEKPKQIPALRPITPKKLDPITEPYVNPLKFCEVTLQDETKEQEEQPKRTSLKKYECRVCSRNFGWSTDLKRHILTHTGERPFRCKLCESTFTRNFLLQKHMSKSHSGDKAGIDVRIPDLKPIRGLKQKSRKQEKYKIKRKMFEKGVYESENGYELKTDILCSS